MTYRKNTTIKRAAIYIRVSTDGQTVDNQRLELEQAAKSAGWEIVGIYDDNGVSGAKSREYRIAFDRLCKDATRRKFDVVMAWSVDRLGRSLQGLIGFLSELHAVGVDLYLHQQLESLMIATELFGSSNPRLDAELILMAMMSIEQRLLVHPEKISEEFVEARMCNLLDKLLPRG